MAVNKVVYVENGVQKTLVDLTGDTVTADKLEKDATAHDKAGNMITGTKEITPQTLIEHITMKGIGQSYLFVGDKTGYVLTNIYNYGREYNDVRITDFSYNGSEKVYYVFLDKTQATTASMALRLVWEKA